MAIWMCGSCVSCLNCPHMSLNKALVYPYEQHWFSTCYLHRAYTLPWKILASEASHISEVTRYLGETFCMAHIFDVHHEGEWNTWYVCFLCLSLSNRLSNHFNVYVFLIERVFIFILLSAATQSRVRFMPHLVVCLSLLVCSGFMTGHKSTSVRNGLDWHLKLGKWKMFSDPKHICSLGNEIRDVNSFFSPFFLNLYSDICFSSPNVSTSSACLACNSAELSGNWWTLLG